MLKNRAKIALLLVVSVILGLFIVLQTSLFQQWLLRSVQNLARGAGISFSARNLNLSIWELKASLDGFVFNDGKGIQVSADRLSIDVPWDIFRSDVIVINEFESDGVVIDIRSPEPVLPEPSGETTPFPQFRFGRLLIQNARLRYANQTTIVDVPSFAIDLRNGTGTLRLDSPVTISPDTRLEIGEIPIQMADNGLRFGPGPWVFGYRNYSANGTTQGNVRWSPALALDLDYSTDPFGLQNFQDIQSSAKLHFENGVLNVTDFRASSGRGQIEGSAEISDGPKSANFAWSSVALDPAGFPAVTNGTLGLNWTASDFGDVSGEGSVSVNSRQFGNIESDIQIQNGRATADLVATAFDTNVRAKVTTGIDQNLSGTFRAVYRKYGVTNLEGTIGGTIQDPVASAQLTVRGLTYNSVGPMDASAMASLKSMILSVTDIQARLKTSAVNGGFLQVNLRNNAISGEVPSVVLQIEDFIPDAMGNANLAATINGTIQEPAAEITGASSGFQVGGTHIDSVEFMGELAGSEFRLSNLTARQQEGVLQASGSVNLSNEAVAGTVEVTNLTVNQIQGLSTTAFLDANIRGTYRAPSADFTAQLRDVVYRDQAHGNLNMDGTADGNRATIRVRSDQYMAAAEADIQLREPYPFTASLTTNNTQVRYQEYDITADGTAELSGQLQPFHAVNLGFDNFTAMGNGMNVSASGSLDTGIRVQGTADLAQLPAQTVQLSGTAQVNAVVRGSLEEPQIDGQLVTSDATVKTETMAEAASIQAAVNFTRDEFVVEQMHATFAGAMASITGAGTLKGSGRFQFQAENIRPEQILKDRPLSGLVSLEGHLEVARPSLEAITGQVRVTNFQLSVRDIAIEQVQPIQVTVKDQILSVDSFAIEGLSTRATITGTANLQTRALNLDINGNTDIRIIEALLPNSNARGQIRTSVALRGSAARPDLQGFLNVEDMQVDLIEPPVFLAGTTAEIRFSGDRIEIAQATGTINGGNFTAAGGAGLSTAGLRDAELRLDLTGAEVEYPEGLVSELSSQIALTGSGSNLELSGNVDILNAIYRRDIDLTEEVFERITSRTSDGLLSGTSESSYRDQIRLNITVSTTGPVSVVNNVANLDLNGVFQLRGTLGEPIILGTANALEGGELFFGPQLTTSGTSAGTERRDRYIIERGGVDFNNPILTEPNFDFVATHELVVKTERYLIQLEVTGTPQNLRTELTSNPSKEEQDIIAMLLTGRTFKELQGAHLAVVREQAFNYLSGQLGGFFQNAGSVLGLDTVRLEPIMLAEEDISARLTIGKDITEDFSLVYSQDLGAANDQSWIATYETVKDLIVRGVNDADKNSTRVEIRQDLRWGGGPDLPERVTPEDEAVLGEVEFEGTTWPKDELLDEVTETGKPFNAYRMNEDIRKLRRFFADRGYLDAKIRGTRNSHDGRTDVLYAIEQGPKITLTYEGGDVPRRVQADIRSIWLNAFSDAASLRDSEARLLRHFRDEGYLEAKVSHREASISAEDRLFVYEIEQGREHDDPKWVFVGIEPVDVPESAGTVLENPTVIKERIEYDLRKQGYLDATSTLPELMLEGRPTFQVRVEQGPLYSLGKITFDGNRILEHDELQAVLNGAQTESNTFTSDWLNTARQRLISKYWENGFNDVQVLPVTRRDPAAAAVNVTFDVTEGEQQIIDSVRISGNDITDTDHLSRYFLFEKGDPVDYARINLTRKNLYDTRLFKRTEIDVVQNQGRYIAEVNLNENAPWRFRYGFAAANKRQTTDRDLGVTADFSYGNLFGKGVTLGTSAKATSAERDGRIYASFPVFMGRDVTTSATVFRTRDLSIPESITDLWGVTIQQQWRLRNLYVLSYDYSYKRNHTFVRGFDPDDPFDFNVTFPIARFNGTLSRDSRDDILNATKGTFLSSSTEIAPPGVGSSIRFIKNYTQYMKFRPVWGNKVWASAVRLGLARGFGGQELILDERFTAGGPTSVRGFRQDRLSPEPGNAVFSFTQEIRSPLFWRFGGAAFFDAGNVYPKIGNLNPFKLRYSPGFGLRIETPFVLIRMDLGFNLSPRTDEPRHRFSFGIGQAF